MANQQSDRFARYLAAKVSVDDRARNGHVWETLVTALAGAGPAEDAGGALQVLEIGAGIGTMIERLVVLEVLSDSVYTALDLSPDALAIARERLPVRLAEAGWRPVEAGPDRLRFERGGRWLEVVPVVADAATWLARRDAESLDLVIAHAVLDELDADALLPRARRCLVPGGLLYASLCFDGLTAIEPELDRALDARVEERYHATMDARLRGGEPAGDSRSGRHLFARLRRHGFDLLAAGGSDWVVAAGPGGYPEDEAFFLRYLVDGVRHALVDDPAFAPGEVAAWTEARHAQIDRGELVWIAHNLDLLAGAPRG